MDLNACALSLARARTYNVHTHAHTHARTHTHTRAHTHTHIRTHIGIYLYCNRRHFRSGKCLDQAKTYARVICIRPTLSSCLFILLYCISPVFIFPFTRLLVFVISRSSPYLISPPPFSPSFAIVYPSFHALFHFGFLFSFLFPFSTHSLVTLSLSIPLSSVFDIAI